MDCQSESWQAADQQDTRHLKHKGKPAVHGFKAHVGADADTALVEQVSVTSANINDGRAGPEALPDNPGEVFAGVEDGRRPPRLSWQPLP